MFCPRSSDQGLGDNQERLVAVRRGRAWGARGTARADLRRRVIAEARVRPCLVVLPSVLLGRPQTPITGPNIVWSVDFKVQFKLGNGCYCNPVTV